MPANLQKAYDAYMKKTKKENELQDFKQFYKQYKLPKGKIDYGDKPDVVIRGKRKIGIEITRFYLEAGNLPESEQHQKYRRQETIKRAHQYYLQQTGKNHNVTIGFDKKNPIKDTQQLAKQIADYCAHIQLPMKGMLPRDTFKHIPELEAIYFDDREYAKPRWRLHQVHSVPVMSLKNLEKLIRKKELKANAYEKCDALWLLIVVDFMDPAQDSVIENAGLTTIASTVFEKIFILKTELGTLYEI